MLIDSQIVEIQKQIILKLKELINFKNFEPGDKLPSERMLAEKFGVTRSNLREALQKLEFYGLVKSIPQSGTFVADIGITAMNGMIDDILNLSIPTFKDLVEARIFLELKGVKLAALRRTTDDLIHLENTLADYSAKVIKGEDAVQEDLLFHLAIAKASANPTINTFMLKITPEIITNFEKHHVCDKDTAFKGIEEHKAIIDAIRNQDPDQAKIEMKKHFKDLYQYCYNI
ncbi:MAG: FadR/GntR family transcriptional regulator [Flavobacteriaceae bacterium]